MEETVIVVLGHPFVLAHLAVFFIGVMTGAGGITLVYGWINQFYRWLDRTSTDRYIVKREQYYGYHTKHPDPDEQAYSGGGRGPSSC